MRIAIALFLPWLIFFPVKRRRAGTECLLLQMTLIGWVPAAIWALYALRLMRTTDRRIAKAIDEALNRNSSIPEGRTLVA